MLVRFVTQDFLRSRCNGRERRPAIDHRMIRRAGRAAEVKAQVAMNCVVRGERLVVLETVHNISGAREQQRQQRKQRYDAVVAETANVTQRGDGTMHRSSRLSASRHAGNSRIITGR